MKVILHQFSVDREKRRFKGQEWRSTKGETTENVLAGLEIQAKLIVEQGKHLQLITHQSCYFLFVLNGQQNERLITVKASQGTAGTTHKILGRNTTYSCEGILSLR